MLTVLDAYIFKHTIYQTFKSSYYFYLTAQWNMFYYLHTICWEPCFFNVSFVLQDSERFLTRSQDLEYQLSSKEKELELLSNKQKRVRVLHFYDLARICTYRIKQVWIFSYICLRPYTVHSYYVKLCMHVCLIVCNYNGHDLVFPVIQFQYLIYSQELPYFFSDCCVINLRKMYLG